MGLLGVAVYCAAAGMRSYEQTVGKRHLPLEWVALDQVDHAAWNDLLSRYVDQQGMVDYAGWKASQQDLAALDEYLSDVARGDPALPCSEAARLAFWINAYNALTVHGILGKYPTTSIRNHTASIVGFNLWDDLRLPVGDRHYSLNQIEHEMLRPRGEPRIHFAIVCASRGCPPLRAEAYWAQSLDAQLDENAQAFFADGSKFRHDPETGHFELSPILQWFGADFGATPAARLRRIAAWLPSEQARSQAAAGRGTIQVLPYDWSLNEQSRR